MNPGPPRFRQGDRTGREAEGGCSRARFKNITGIALAAVLFLWSPAAQAQTPKNEAKASKASLFHEMDKNGDGQVIREEFMAFYEGAFSRLKQDDQGNVSVETLNVYYTARFKMLDKNGDGFIAKDEYATPGMDTNGDGKTSLEEWSAFFVAQVKMMDTDQDGKVSPQEYTAYCLAYFKAADRDSDGVIVLKEWMTPRPPAKKGDKK